VQVWRPCTSVASWPLGGDLDQRESAGILWKKPYQVDISQLVQPGTNDLKIEVVNLWINRIAGDMLLDPKDRFCKTNQSYMTSEIWPGGDEPFRIQTAGLLGPVSLIEK